MTFYRHPSFPRMFSRNPEDVYETVDALKTQGINMPRDVDLLAEDSIELLCSAPFCCDTYKFIVPVEPGVLLSVTSNYLTEISQQAEFYRRYAHLRMIGKLFMLDPGDSMNFLIPYTTVLGIAEHDWAQHSEQAKIWEQKRLEKIAEAITDLETKRMAN